MPRVPHTLASLATLIGGSLSGDGALRITGVAPLETAGPDQITFAQSAKHLKNIAACRAGAIIIPADQALAERNTIAVENPRLAFIQLVHLFHPQPRPAAGIHATAALGREVQLGEACAIGAHVAIGDGVCIGARAWIEAGVVIEDDVTIGDDVHLYANVIIRAGSRLGHRVILHPGCVIGADGFGFVPGDSQAVKVPQIGHVQIDDDVEIGANSTIDRATFGKTWIQTGVKIDNLVHIGHNCTVGAHSLIMALVGVSGSVRIGKGVILAGNSGVSDHVEIGDGAIVGPKTGLGQSLGPGETVMGKYPPLPFKTWLRVQRDLKRLPQIKKRLERLERLSSKDGD